jgi:hypothetical protein
LGFTQTTAGRTGLSLTAVGFLRIDALPSLGIIDVVQGEVVSRVREPSLASD